MCCTHTTHNREHLKLFQIQQYSILGSWDLFTCLPMCVVLIVPTTEEQQQLADMMEGIVGCLSSTHLCTWMHACLFHHCYPSLFNLPYSVGYRLPRWLC